jgi:kynureninase
LKADDVQEHINFKYSMGSGRHAEQIKHGPPLAPDVDIRAHSKEYAASLDAQDALKGLRDEFMVPSQADLKRATLSSTDQGESSIPSIYLCGNSLGLQPRRTKERISSFLEAWATKAVTGHFRNHSDSALPSFVDADDYAAKLMAPIVGAREDEIAVMGTLTSNLHLLMASFYRPTRDKYKIILEGKSFPSDHVCSSPVHGKMPSILYVEAYLGSLPSVYAHQSCSTR